MSSSVDRTAGEIDWPAQLSRTPPAERKHTHKFSVTFNDALSEIGEELIDRVEADGWHVSTAAPHRKRDGLPYADASPDDPGVVIRWTDDGQQYAVACDQYTDRRDNARAIGLYIREKRKMADRPVTTGRDEFATAALPSGNEDAIALSEGAGASVQADPHEVLGVREDADPAVVKGAYRELVKEAHGDQGDRDDLDVAELRRAKEKMLEDTHA